MIYTQKGCLQSVVNSLAAFLFIVISDKLHTIFFPGTRGFALKINLLENTTISAFLNSIVASHRSTRDSIVGMGVSFNSNFKEWTSMLFLFWE